MAEDKGQMTIRMPKSLKDDVMHLAESLGISANAVAVLAMRTYLASQEKEADEKPEHTSA